MIDATIKTKWVLGRYTGKEAKRVMDMAHNGLGYFIIDQPEKGDAWIVAAFRRPMDTPLPSHLEEITDYRLSDKLNIKRIERQGLHEEGKAVISDISHLTYKERSAIYKEFRELSDMSKSSIIAKYGTQRPW